jgi:hypothetical protein
MYYAPMKQINETFKAKVFSYLERSGMYPTDFGINAAKDRAFITRLKAGRSPSLKTADRVLDWMRDNPPRRKR